jgi:hypothetical protein
MILESAQILSTILRLKGINNDSDLYKQTHIKHPCVIWAGKSKGNFEWLLKHAIAISNEYTLRYFKIHKSLKVIQKCFILKNQIKFDLDMQTPFALAMPDECKIPNNPVESYRKYYKTHKKDISEWKDVRGKPEWWE